MKAKKICILVMILLVTTTLSVVGETSNNHILLNSDQDMKPKKSGVAISETFYANSSDGYIYSLDMVYDNIWGAYEGIVESGDTELIIGQDYICSLVSCKAVSF